MVKIKSHTEYHSSDGYDIDDIVERVANKFTEENIIISVNTTPIYKTTDKGSVIVKGVFITIVYK